MFFCNILDYGAVPGTVVYSTDAIQRAIDECAKNGGGEVIIPAGEYLTGDIYLHSNITLHLLSGAKLIASKNPEDYFNYRGDKLDPMGEDELSNEPWVRQNMGVFDPNVVSRVRKGGSRWSNAIIRAWNAHDIAVIGDEGSLIDGMDCFDAWGEENYRGPHGMGFFKCRNITLAGYTIQRTGNWAHYMTFCENLTVDGITVEQGHDGIHMNECRNITIKKSRFYTGDDSIAGFGNVNVLVSGGEINSACSAFRFGGTNVYVEKCHIFAPAKYGFRGAMSDEDKASGAPSPTKGIRNNMLSAMTYYADYNLPIEYQPGNIVFDDCDIEMADRFLHFNFSGNERWQANRPMTDITFKNIRAKGISMPLTAYGAADVPFTLCIENTEIGIRDGAKPTALIHAANCELVKLKNIKLDGFTGDTLVRTWSDNGTAVISGIDCDGEYDHIKAADVPFFTKAI